MEGKKTQKEDPNFRHIFGKVQEVFLTETCCEKKIQTPSALYMAHSTALFGKVQSIVPHWRCNNWLSGGVINTDMMIHQL